MAAISTTTAAYFSSQPQLPATAAAKSGGRQQQRRRSSFVMLEAAAASGSGGGGGGAVGRTRSLTEEDLEELKGCLDLGFGFAYHEIPELCGTLPALELCYSMTRRFLDEQRAPGQEPESPATPPLPNWRISGPGKAFPSPRADFDSDNVLGLGLCQYILDYFLVVKVCDRFFLLFCWSCMI